MRSLFISLLLTLYVTSGCGSKVEPVAPSIPTQASREVLVDKLSQLYPTLLTCDGGITDDEPNTITGRPQCNTGDSIGPIGLVSLVSAEPGFEQYLRDSIGEDGRPYRSPEHLRACLVSGEVSHQSACDFSRDHLIGHLFYAIANRDSQFILRIYGYMETHADRICADPSYAQCGLTIPLWDVLGDTFRYLGLPVPLKMKMPNAATILAENLTVATSSEFQLSLVAEVIHLKYITGNLTTDYLPILDELVKKQPLNLYFRWLRNTVITHSDSEMELITVDLIKLIDRRIEQGPGTVWLWSWPDEPENMNGWELLFLGKLLLSNPR